MSSSLPRNAPMPLPKGTEGVPAPPPPTDPGPLGTGRAQRGPVALGFLYAVGALLALFLGQQLLRVGSVVILVVVALFIAVGLDPAVQWLQRRGLGRSSALLAVIAVVLLALVLFLDRKSVV